jgi:hypothetical protein
LGRPLGYVSLQIAFSISSLDLLRKLRHVVGQLALSFIPS